MGMNTDFVVSGDGNDRFTELNLCAGRIIRQLRRERHMSGEVLGVLTGYSQQQISRYERGGCCFTLSVLMRFAEALGVSVWELLEQVRGFYITDNNSYSMGYKLGGSVFV
ncbi:helix-turn-helix transcriptional regulator [Morganella morganii]